MVGKPTLGYPTKKAAIWALLDQGIPHKEIAEKVDGSQQSVYVEASAKRNYENRMKLDGRRIQALRIYRRALDVIGDALGIEPESLHSTFAKLPYSDLAFVDRMNTPPEVIETQAEPDEPETTPEDAPPAPEPGQIYTLHDFRSGQFLSKSGTSTTRYKDIAYRGTFEQATAARDASTAASGMRIVRI